MVPVKLAIILRNQIVIHGASQIGYHLGNRIVIYSLSHIGYH